MAKILVIDDEQALVWAFERFITSLGHVFLSAATAEAGLDLARREDPDIVLMDIKLPGMDGLAAVEKLREFNTRAKVIVITAHGTLDTAVRAVKLGTVEYLAKPVDLARARKLIEESLHAVPKSGEVERLRAEVAGKRGLNSIVGKTAAMQEIFKKIAAVCESDVNVLLLGESGTGKELIARAIHYNSKRANGPFEPINCASIPETLLESELYGHEKGAFTGAARMKKGKFEVAHGGTIFLDEVGEISPTAQVKLLRFLETHAFERVGGTENIDVDIRIVSATNQNLEERIAGGRFREDLFFRLNVVRIEIPPLRDRVEDIPLLVAHFLELVDGTGIASEAMARLRTYPWPGNVRELRNAIERASVLARGKTIGLEHLPDAVINPRAPAASDLESRVRALVDELVASGPRGDAFRHVEAHWEKALLRRALEVCHGNQVKASDLLGINRMTLRKKMEQYGL